MKKIITISLLLSVFALPYSCVGDFDKTNTNPNNIYKTTPELTFPGIVLKSMNGYAKLNHHRFSVLSNYAVNWLEQKDTEDMSEYYEDFYVKSLNDLGKLERDYGGTKEANPNVSHILMTWKAWLYYHIASTWGGMPMSVVNPLGSESKYFKYDSQEEMYKNILDLLDKAVDGFDPATDGLLSDPLLEKAKGKGSDVAKWRVFANTLRLNVALTIQNMNPGLAKEHIEKALSGGRENYLISSLDGNIKFKWYAGDGTENGGDSYYYLRFLREMNLGGQPYGGYTYPAMSHNFFLYMRSYNDPRLPKYVAEPADEFRAIKKGDTITRVNPILRHLRDSLIVNYSIPYVPRREGKHGAPSGWTPGTDPHDPSGGTYRDPYGEVESNNRSECLVNLKYVEREAESVLFSLAEVCFMKAEVAIKYPGVVVGTAQQHYEDGIRASMAQNGVTAADAAKYMEMPGVKWDTDGDGMWEYRKFYKADIKGHGGDENHLEQIYKQWYIADFFYGHAGWTLERRTRAMKFPPHFYNNASNEGSNGMCDYMQERLLYPTNERSLNAKALGEAIAQLQADSPAPNGARGGDNFFTLLKFAAPQPGGGDLSRWTQGGTLEYCGAFIRHWYGNTFEELLATTKSTTEADLKKKINYELQAVRSGYDPVTGEHYKDWNEVKGRYNRKYNPVTKTMYIWNETLGEYVEQPSL